MQTAGIFSRAILRFLTTAASGCGTSTNTPSVAAPPNQVAKENAVVSDRSLLAVLWFQRAAECRALYYRACNLARERIDQYLQARRHSAAPANEAMAFSDASHDHEFNRDVARSALHRLTSHRVRSAID
jgi:hypothetical protein